MNRILSFVGWAGLLGLLAGCITEPNYSDVPNIEFVSVVNRSLPQEFIDSVYITIRIEDGDGDLGLSKDQVDPPFSPTVPDANGNPVPNRFVHNYFLDVERKVNGEFRPVTFLDGANFNGRYPVLRNSRGAIEVNLTYGFEVFVGVAGSPFRRGDEVRFQVQIADRALNLSNIITTETIVIGEGQ